MKKILLIFLSVFAFVTAHAEITWELSDDGTLTISGTNMPDYDYNETPWYSQREDIKKVEIKKGVTTIGKYAFRECKGLTSITIPNSVTSIGNDAFYGCSALTSIEIPNSVTKIGNLAFYECGKLTSIFIPKNVKEIGERAFSQCNTLSSVNVAEENKYYDSRGNCNAIIQSNNNTIIAGCCNTIIPNTVTTIGYSAFAGSNIASIFIPGNITRIDTDAFYECSGLSSVVIPHSVKSIGDWAFCGCKNLKDVTIHVNNQLTIGIYAFSYTDLTTLTMYGESLPNSVAEGFVIDNTYKTTTLSISYSLYNKYRSTEPWNKFKNIKWDTTANMIDGISCTEFSPDIYKQISYIRNFNNTSWQSLYIPFSMTFDDWKDDFEVAYINGIRQMDTDDDGAIDETIMDVVKIKSGSLIPNTPYLIKAKTTGNKTITVNDATLYKAESNSVDCSTTIAKYTFTGTYSTIPAATLLANNYYAMGGGSLIMTDGTSDLKPFRWYLNVESRSPMYNVSSGAKAITINVVGEEETTDISQMSSDREHSSAIYDLNGRRMSQKNMKSGLYIKNGKKIIIK